MLLADGNIGIGGDPAALLRRVGDLLAPDGHALVEVQAPGVPLRSDRVRLCREGAAGDWFPWAYVGADQIGDVARGAGLVLRETWTAGGRWFAALDCEPAAVAGPFADMSAAGFRGGRPRACRPCPGHDGESAGLPVKVPAMTVKVRVSAVSAALVIVCGLEFLVIHPAADPLPVPLQPLPLVTVAWVLFVAAAWLLRGVPLRWAVALIIIGAIAIQVVAVSGPPQSSTDLYRYMWDGRVQAHGYDPYSYVPMAPQLAHIRDPFLFNHHALARFCVGAGVHEPGYPGLTLAPGCTRINRPTVPTIYPPVAEFYFLALHYVTPVWAGSTPVQAAAGACAVLVTLLLLAGLRWLRRDLRWAALWAWCPTVALEAGNNAHVDVVAVLLTLAALLVLALRGTGAGAPCSAAHCSAWPSRPR